MTKHSILAAASVAAISSSLSHAALVAGDVAIIGRTNDATPDAFAIVTLAPIAAGEVVYFTDNGWLTAGGFRGATATDGNGNEELTRLTFNNAVAAGTIISSGGVSPDYAWSTSGTIGDNTQSYASLSFSQAGDSITAFQTTEANDPIFVTANMTHLFFFDDTNGFENATSSGTSDLPPGLSIAAGTVASLNAMVGGTIAFDTSVLAGGTKQQWLAEIADPANWTQSTLPSGSIVVPEPASLSLLAISALAGLRRRRA